MLGDGGLAGVLWRRVGVGGRVFRGDAVLRGSELGRSVRLSHCVRGSCCFLITLKKSEVERRRKREWPPGRTFPQALDHSYPDTVQVPARCQEPESVHPSSSSSHALRKQSPSFIPPILQMQTSRLRNRKSLSPIIQLNSPRLGASVSHRPIYLADRPTFIPFWGHVRMVLSPTTAEPCSDT